MDRSSDRRVLYKSRKTLKNKDFVEWVTAQRSISKPLTSAYYYVFIARCSQNRRETKGVTRTPILVKWNWKKRGNREGGMEGRSEKVWGQCEAARGGLLLKLNSWFGFFLSWEIVTLQIKSSFWKKEKSKDIYLKMLPCVLTFLLLHAYIL